MTDLELTLVPIDSHSYMKIDPPAWNFAWCGEGQLKYSDSKGPYRIGSDPVLICGSQKISEGYQLFLFYWTTVQSIYILILIILILIFLNNEQYICSRRYSSIWNEPLEFLCSYVWFCYVTTALHLGFKNSLRFGITSIRSISTLTKISS